MSEDVEGVLNEGDQYLGSNGNLVEGELGKSSKIWSGLERIY